MAEVYKIGASLDSSNSPKEQENILKLFEGGDSVIIDMTGFIEHFEIFDTMEECQKAIGK